MQRSHPRYVERIQRDTSLPYREIAEPELNLRELVYREKRQELMSDRQMTSTRFNPYDLKRDHNNDTTDDKKRLIETFHHKYPLQKGVFLDRFKRDSEYMDKFLDRVEKKRTPRDRCRSCQKEALFLCSGCRRVWYCSKQCQVREFDFHSI